MRYIASLFSAMMIRIRKKIDIHDKKAIENTKNRK